MLDVIFNKSCNAVVAVYLLVAGGTVCISPASAQTTTPEELCKMFPRLPQCEQATLPGTPVTTRICKLENVTNDWISKANLVGDAVHSTERVIGALQAAINLEIDPKRIDISQQVREDAATLPRDKFGSDAVTQTQNRKTILDSFKSAKITLSDSIKLSAGGAEPLCVDCFSLRDWFVLQYFAELSAKTHAGVNGGTSGASKIGLGLPGQIQATKDNGDGTGPLDQGKPPINLIEITDKALRTEVARTSMRYIKTSLCNASERDLEIGQAKAWSAFTKDVAGAQAQISAWIVQDGWKAGEFGSKFGGNTLGSLKDKIDRCDPSDFALSTPSIKSWICSDPEVVAERARRSK